MMELKPCPFCGGNAYPGSSTIGYTIQCGDCGATSVCMLALDAAVERWNRRATDENAAYERAARVCEESANNYREDFAWIPLHCAAAIRALIKEEK